MNENIFGETICTYTVEEAIDDGVLVELGKVGNVPVLATSNCFSTAGLDNPLHCKGVVMEAIEALRKPDPEDSPTRKMRVLHEGVAADYERLWVFHDAQGITLMLPEDY